MQYRGQEGGLQQSEWCEREGSQGCIDTHIVLQLGNAPLEPTDMHLMVVMRIQRDLHMGVGHV